MCARNMEKFSSIENALDRFKRNNNNNKSKKKLFLAQKWLMYVVVRCCRCFFPPLSESIYQYLSLKMNISRVNECVRTECNLFIIY